MNTLLTWLVALTLSLAGLNAAAQQSVAAGFPLRTVQIVVPFPAGGSTDTLTRLISTKLAERWGRPVVVDNRAGGFGVIGQNAVERAPADGHTILMGITSFTYQSALRPNTLDFTRTFTPLAMIGEVHQGLIVSSKLQIADVKQLVSMAKAHPEKFSYGTAGAGSTAHIYGEMLNAQAGINMLHVPYRGGPALMTDVLGEQIPVAFMDRMVIAQNVSSGKFRVLATTGPQRSPSLPGVPTFTELGFKDFDTVAFIGYFVHRNTPPELVKKISEDIVQVASMPEVAARIADTGMGTKPVGGAEFAKLVNEGREVWESVIKSRNISIKD